MKFYLSIYAIFLVALPYVKSETMPKVKKFDVNGRLAVIHEPAKLAEGKPWVWYAPTLKGSVLIYDKIYYRDAFFKAGISLAGYDLGEVRGAPTSTAKFNNFYEEMVKRGYSAKPILLGQSRGGLMLLSWAVRHPEKLRAFVGIYPVLNLTSWPLRRSKKQTLTDYKLTKKELITRLAELNPINKVSGLLKHKVPVFIVHGDSDGPVPYEKNSALLQEQYEKGGGRIEVKLIKGGGHEVSPAFFECPELVNFTLKELSLL